MALFFFKLAGPERDRVGREFDTVDEARNGAVRHLGAYLSDHPEFANEGHWRVDVEDEFGRSLLHVIVATVNARRPLNGD